MGSLTRELALREMEADKRAAQVGDDPRPAFRLEFDRRHSIVSRYSRGRYRYGELLVGFDAFGARSFEALRRRGRYARLFWHGVGPNEMLFVLDGLCVEHGERSRCRIAAITLKRNGQRIELSDEARRWNLPGCVARHRRPPTPDPSPPQAGGGGRAAASRDFSHESGGESTLRSEERRNPSPIDVARHAGLRAR